MKFFITFSLFFLASYIVCQTILSNNVSTSSSNVNGVTTTTTTQTVQWSNGSTVITKTVTVQSSSGTSTTKTVTVNPTSGGGSSGSAVLIGTSTSSSNVNGVSTVTVTNTYNNATTVTIKTVTSGNTITKTTTVKSPSGTNTWVSTTTGGGSPSTPAPVRTPAPSTPAPVRTPAPSTPAPAPSTPAPSPSTSTATQNPVTLASSDPYSKFNYKVPSTISYADIRNVHMEYINGARDCMGIQNTTWDDTIAAHAQAWANTCNIYHASGSTSPANPSGNSDTIGEGENIYTFSGSNLKATDAMIRGNEFFNKESSVFNCAGNTCSGTCGHYTQNVWSKTTKIGCGVANCNGGFYGVCRYYPRGNFNQQTVHPFGSASVCSKGSGSARNQGFDVCKARTQSTGRSLNAAAAVQSPSTTTSTQTNRSAPFFNSDSQIVVFALAIVITVIVAACFIVLVVIAKRSTSNKELDYQLLESK
eukprot:TRINITY_DN271_c0_g1_i2.p1 TRINITY_DN271_c0_g1~~TRINITY_DN271_c0_g1_i2.p1  ORF type:complete len:474 (+),score=156.36 TRINITY_DN271_c0_g1_i2:158-1579(+)